MAPSWIALGSDFRQKITMSVSMRVLGSMLLLDDDDADDSDVICSSSCNRCFWMQGIVDLVYRSGEDLETHVMMEVRVVSENASVVKADTQRPTNNTQHSPSFILILVASLST